MRGADNLPTDHGWLNQVSDEASTGLVYLNARYYDPEASRFVSPDPLLKPMDPRTLDAYRYADNNPITYTDATGLSPCSGLPGGAEAACLKMYYNGMKSMGVTAPPKGKTTSTVISAQTAQRKAFVAAVAQDDNVFGLHYPTEFDDTSAQTVLDEFFSGQGPRSHSFMPGTPFSNGMKDSWWYATRTGGGIFGESTWQSNIRAKYAAGTLTIGFDESAREAGTGKGYYYSTYSYSGFRGVGKYMRDAQDYALSGNLPPFMVGSHRSRFIVESVNDVNKTADIFVVGWNQTDAESGTRPPVVGYLPGYDETVGKEVNRVANAAGITPVRQYFYFTETIQLD